MVIALKKINIFLHQCTDQYKKGAEIIVAQKNGVINTNKIKFLMIEQYSRQDDEIAFNLEELTTSMQRIVNNEANIAGFTFFDVETAQIFLNLGEFQNHYNAKVNVQFFLRMNNLTLETEKCAVEKENRTKAIQEMMEEFLLTLCKTKIGIIEAIQLWENYHPTNLKRPGFLKLPIGEVPFRTFKSELQYEKMMQQKRGRRHGPQY